MPVDESAEGAEWMGCNAFLQEILPTMIQDSISESDTSFMSMMTQKLHSIYFIGNRINQMRRLNVATEQNSC
jgi:hypothetical protein